LDFKFLVKPKDGDPPCFVEEDPTRVLKGGTLEEDMRAALFKIKSDSGEEIVIKCRISLKEDLVSPFDLAASWRAYQGNFQPSRVRGIPDVVMHVEPHGTTEV
jgi:6-phosphofructo-2-kinase / fructose-2,6-biphosphatase 3